MRPTFGFISRLGRCIVAILGTMQSLKDARRYLDELAVSGEYKAKEYGEFSVVYSKLRDGIEELITIEKRGKRQWSVVKRHSGESTT